MHFWLTINSTTDEAKHESLISVERLKSKLVGNHRSTNTMVAEQITEMKTFKNGYTIKMQLAKFSLSFEAIIVT